MSEMNVETARFNMVEQQVRPWEVLDDQVLNLLSEVPREEFVPARYTNLAFADMSIPLGHGEVMMPPKLEAHMIQALHIQPGDTVLEIGTGSGFVTSLLARLARFVYSVDIHEDFVAAARQKLKDDGTVNVMLEQGDAAMGWPSHGPYHAIAVTGSLPVLPSSLQESLAPGGRLFAVIGDAPVMEATLITRVGPHEFQQQSLLETQLPALQHCQQPERFTF